MLDQVSFFLKLLTIRSKSSVQIFYSHKLRGLFPFCPCLVLQRMYKNKGWQSVKNKQVTPVVADITNTWNRSSFPAVVT